jgi:hypothetical protein
MGWAMFGEFCMAIGNGVGVGIITNNLLWGVMAFNGTLTLFMAAKMARS